MVLLPLCQLPIRQVPIGDHELELSGPWSCSSSAENSNFKRRLPRKHMRRVCVCVCDATDLKAHRPLPSNKLAYLKER